jgi:hypothetical protein
MVDGGWWIVVDGGWWMADGGSKRNSTLPSTVPQSDRNGIHAKTRTTGTARQAVWSAFRAEQHLHRPFIKPSFRCGMNGSVVVVHQHREHANTRTLNMLHPTYRNRNQYPIESSAHLHCITHRNTTANRNHDHRHQQPLMSWHQLYLHSLPASRISRWTSLIQKPPGHHPRS